MSRPRPLRTTPLLPLALALSLLLPLLPPAAGAREPAPVPPHAGQAAQPLGPEPATRRGERALALADRAMVAAAHPLAAEAGRDMLRRGGSAVDAAIAAQLVLGVVEPQSSGLGGGGFLLLAGPDGRITSYDGRETAPAGTRPDRFLDAEGEPLPFLRALDGGRSVGVPGLPALLKHAHSRHGRLPWADLFQPAIDLAENGFPAPPRMVEVLTSWRHMLDPREDLRAVFYRDGAGPPVIGEWVRFPAHAATLRTLASQGPDALYAGPLGEAVLARLAAAAGPDSPALPTAADLAAYRVVEREPVCRPYRVWRVCGMGPPSSGGVAVLQILAMLEPFPLAGLGPDSPAAWHLMAEASRRAYADRDLFIADPDHAPVPVAGLLDSQYLAGRAAGIDPQRASPAPLAAGNPPWREGRAYGPGSGPDIPSTTHLSVVDAEGMVVAMTTSVEFAFGSGLIAEGLVLNNQLSDFSFTPTAADGRPVANAPGPGKRPRSSMSPMIVFDGQGRPVITLGSPGGSAIIGYVAKALVGMLDWELDPQAAIDLPNIVNRNGPTVVEPVAAADGLAEGLRALGHEVERAELNSGLHAIRIMPGRLLGGADPRRDGVALGD